MYKMESGAFVSAQVLKMKGNIDTLETLNACFAKELVVNLILALLSNCYDQFKMNYNMNKLDKIITKLDG